jgi:drug/metabolite transporter (DMT)-like permease
LPVLPHCNTLSPIFTVIIAVFLLKERVEHFRWFLFALAFLGIILIKGFDGQVSNVEIILGVLSAALSGVAYNAIIKCKHTDHPLTIVMYFPLVATPVMGVWCLFDWVTPVGNEWWMLLIIGVFTQMAQVCMTKALHSDKSSKIVPFKYLGSVYAIIFGYTIFFEELTWVNICGMLLVLGVVIANSLIKSKS